MTKVENDSLGTTVVRLKQIFKGVPVWGFTQVAHINKEGVLNVFSGSVVPNISQNLKNQEQGARQQFLLFGATHDCNLIETSLKHAFYNK
ncbi:hypothetical protein OCE25_28470 [Bacillus cereus]|nr:hypothetical protein [Bacillus cereus]